MDRLVDVRPRERSIDSIGIDSIGAFFLFDIAVLEVEGGYG